MKVTRDPKRMAHPDENWSQVRTAFGQCEEEESLFGTSPVVGSPLHLQGVAHVDCKGFQFPLRRARSPAGRHMSHESSCMMLSPGAHHIIASPLRLQEEAHVDC